MALTGLRLYLVDILGARPKPLVMSTMIALWCFSILAVHSLCSMFYNGKTILKVLFKAFILPDLVIHGYDAP